MTDVCSKCGGTGKITYTVPPSGRSVDLGDGVVMEDMGGHSTRACPCVRDLPPIAGHARWWELETLYRTVVDAFIYDISIDVTAECEVPRDERGRRVFRTAENAYYPPLVEMLVEDQNVTMHSETARELGLALIAAADACDCRDALAVVTQPGPLMLTA